MFYGGIIFIDLKKEKLKKCQHWINVRNKRMQPLEYSIAFYHFLLAKSIILPFV